MSIHAEHPNGSGTVSPVTEPPGRSSVRAVVRAVEKMCTTRSNAQLGLVADMTVSAVLLYAGLREGGLNLREILATGAAGLLAFSFFEYAMHRWLFHGPAQAFQKGHLVHHQKPMGHDSLPFFLPPALMLVLACLLHRVVPTVAFLLSGSFAAGYVIYGYSHWIMHSMHFRNPLLRRWAADHHIHHFHDDANFGVTSPLWDILLRTRYIPARRASRPSSPVDRT